jgi:very-short-patch-repair endonuclease
VYRLGGSIRSREQSAMAAALWGGDDALVSHSAAAVLWDLDGVRARKVELWVPTKRKAQSDQITVHRGSRLDRADRTTLGPIPITTPVRTLIDMAGRLEDHRLSTVLEDLIRRDLVTADRLRARLDALRASGRPGGGRLDALLEARGDGRPLESALETRAWPIISRCGVSLPRRQHWVILPGGRYRLDFAWPDLKIGVECEGHAFHGDRSVWGKDRARFAEFTAAGWRVLPVTWQVCRDDPDRVVRWILAAHANAA